MTTALRATTRILGLLGGSAVALSAAPALAQTNDAILLNILRECAKIEDTATRVACYDNNIRGTGATPAAPGQAPAQPTAVAPAVSQAPAGFGSDSIRTPERFDPNRNGPTEITERVAAVREREPGVYLVTLESGAEWLFNESTGRTFAPPRKGHSVKIRRGSLGGYLMVVGQQQGVRVTRVK